MRKVLLIGAEPDRMPRLKLIHKCLDGLGYDVEVFDAAKRGRRTIVRYVINMLKLLFKRADIYHFCNIPDVIGLPLLFKRGKLVYDIRSPWKEVMSDTTNNRYASWFAGWVERRFCRNADVVIAVNPLLKERALDFGAKHCDVVPNVVFEDIKMYELGGPIDVPEATVLYFGKISKVEGSRVLGDILIESNIHEDYPISFLIAGDGPELDALKKRVEDEGISDKVHFLGWIPKDLLWQYIHGVDLCIMPREEDGTSNWIHPDSVWKVNEAINLGTPVLATRIGGFDFEKTDEMFRIGNIGFKGRHRDYHIYSTKNNDFVPEMYNLLYAIREAGKPDPVNRDWTICRDVLKDIYERIDGVNQNK